MYTSKDLQKIFRIGRETIRYYEKIGIIHGKVNATKYHYYDDLDIENLARILKYREFKFPLQQIKKLRSANHISEFQFVLTNQIKHLKSENRIDEILETRLTWKMNELVAYSKGRKSFIKDDFYYDLAYSEEHGFAGNDKYPNFTDLSKTSDFPFSDFIAFTKITDNDELSFTNGGTAISKGIVDNLSIETNQLVHHSFDCIYQSYRVISQRMNDTLNIHPEVALLNKLHYQICNCPYVRQIAILKNKRIVQLNIPVNKSI